MLNTGRESHPSVTPTYTHMLLRTALLVVAASAQQQAYVDPHGAAGEPLAGDLNGDGVLDEYELQQIEQATKSLTESFRAQVRQQLASQYVAQKTGGSKLADSRIASQVCRPPSHALRLSRR